MQEKDFLFEISIIFMDKSSLPKVYVQYAKELVKQLLVIVRNAKDIS